MQTAEPAAKAIFTWLETRHADCFRFWTRGAGQVGQNRLQDHADLVYSLFLLGRGDMINEESAKAFALHVADQALFGRPTASAPKSSTPVNAHLTAYLLGTLRLLQAMGKIVPNEGLYGVWRQDLLIDPSFLPRWPRAWSHHVWRVSHWIGGIPSIILHLSKSGMVPWASDECLLRVLASCEENVIDKKSGLLRPYRSELFQHMFRQIYRLRHDPDLGNLGGVVHLLWVNHAVGRPYVASDALFRAASNELRRTPFMETMPYCLDFDIFQLARTAGQKNGGDLSGRAETFIDDTTAFFTNQIPDSYTLHKLPGALATMHECAYMTGSETVRGLGTERVDIIRTAFWI